MVKLFLINWHRTPTEGIPSVGVRCQFIKKKILCDGIREPVSGSLLYGNNIITGAVIPTSNAITFKSK